MTTITMKQATSYIIKHVRFFPIAILAMFLTALIWAANLSVRPYLLKLLLDRATKTPYDEAFLHLLFPAIGYIATGFLLSSFFRLYGYFVDIKMIPLLRERIANDALGELLEKSPSYYQNTYSGSLANKVNDLTSYIPEVLQIVIDRFFAHSLALIIAMYTLWQVSSTFALLMFGWITLFILGVYLISSYLTSLSDAWAEQGSRITGKIVDTLSNILPVRLFARKEDERRTLATAFHHAVKAEQKLNWAYFWVWFVHGYSFVFVLGLNFYFLLKGRQEGWITIGDFSLVLTINIAIIDFLWQFARDFSAYSKAMGKITQALKAVLSPPEITDKPDAKPLTITRGAIVFNKVDFHYKEMDILFQKVSISILPGQKVGLVGYSGSGKSTFVNLILRLYDIAEGSITIDNQDIRDVTQSSLRKAIAVIPQDPSLFYRSLRDNIRYGNPGATEEDVIKAARYAHAHEFISQLPQDYDTLVGERGTKLSGGQRQRIAIARAILKNAPILILDEATSQLDSTTELIIQEAIWALMQDKTTLVIAHRLSTLLQMDRILVFKQGKIVEDGTHQTLLSQGKLYAELWKAQVGGFLPDRKVD